MREPDDDDLVRHVSLVSGVLFSEPNTTTVRRNTMEADGEEMAGEPEVTIETVPDNIESGYRDAEPGLLTYIQYFLLGYFSNPWALLILAFITYKLYRRLRPFLTEPLADRLW